MSEELEKVFPALADNGYAWSSPETSAYNCIAWAAGESHRWCEPGIYWPVQAADDLAVLMSLFASLGYVPCDDEGFEPGYEKVACMRASSTESRTQTRKVKICIRENSEVAVWRSRPSGSAAWG